MILPFSIVGIIRVFMTDEPRKVGRPKKITASPMGYSGQTRVNHLIHDYYLATEHRDGPGARKILDDLEEILESALK